VLFYISIPCSKNPSFSNKKALQQRPKGLDSLALPIGKVWNFYREYDDRK